MSVGSSGSDYDLLAAPVTPHAEKENEGEDKDNAKASTATATAATAAAGAEDKKKEMPRLFFAGE